MSTKTVPFGEAGQAARPELRYDWTQAEIEGIAGNKPSRNQRRQNKYKSENLHHGFSR